MTSAYILVLAVKDSTVLIKNRQHLAIVNLIYMKSPNLQLKSTTSLQFDYWVTYTDVICLNRQPKLPPHITVLRFTSIHTRLNPIAQFNSINTQFISRLHNISITKP